ncbi:hypothetical protein [Halosimplex pelagicum]|uniref:Uncharacterized protein n=1 Tax=Halosimplex pelagicum TaxID=869886 RepID=A0A7D5PCX3_9EURY|nr:hypothetical protein [Halosimplex pelagicum]QLH83845.1 hypothetical protein HZS54_20395 [Halosimplex pelagicum]
MAGKSADEDLLDELIAETQESLSYFDHPDDLEGTGEESWARIEKDATMAHVLGVDLQEFR